MKRKWMIAVAVPAVVLAVALWCWVGSEPPPATAEELAAIMDEGDPAEMSEPERDEWVRRLASVAGRMSPRQFQVLAPRMMTDTTWRKRFRSLPEADRRKIADKVEQIPVEQRLAMMRQMLSIVKAMPAEKRQEMSNRFRRDVKNGGGPHGGMTKERLMELISKTPPTERAEFVRMMREFRELMEEK